MCLITQDNVNTEFEVSASLIWYTSLFGMGLELGYEHYLVLLLHFGQIRSDRESNSDNLSVSDRPKR